MIDILLPIYNREKYIAECLESLFAQTYQDFKIVIYDDGSTDNSAEIVERFKAKYPDKIVFVKGLLNKGVGYSRSVLFEIEKLSTAKYCVWQDSDDVSHGTRLEYLLAAIESQKVDMLFSEMFFFREPSKYYQTRTIHKIDISKYTNRDGLHNNMNFATAIFKRELVKYQFHQDMLLREDAQWLSELINAGKTFGYLAMPLYYCRRHSGRLTNHGKFN